MSYIPQTAITTTHSNVCNCSSISIDLDANSKASSGRTYSINNETAPIEAPKRTTTNSHTIIPKCEMRNGDQTSISSATVEKQILFDDIFLTVSQLEDTFLETKRYDLKLQLLLDNHAEMVRDLNKSLESERMRNKRLVQLIRGMESASSNDDDVDNCIHSTCSIGLSRGFSDMLSNSDRWQSHSSMDPIESISPLLLQQRFDELTQSHKRCQRQSAKNEKRLTLIKCQNEELQTKYDKLLGEYQEAHKRFESLCWRYLRLQQRKNYEIKSLRDALALARNCLYGAKVIIDKSKEITSEDTAIFSNSLHSFLQALAYCKTPKMK